MWEPTRLSGPFSEERHFVGEIPEIALDIFFLANTPWCFGRRLCCGFRGFVAARSNGKELLMCPCENSLHARKPGEMNFSSGRCRDLERVKK